MSEKPNGESRALSVQDKKMLLVKQVLHRAKSSIEMAIPRHMTPERMIRIACSAASRNPLLLDCTPESFALALINASETGLEPNGRDAHLIPYWNSKANGYEVQFQPDYKGLVQLAYRSGQVKSYSAHAVYEKDFFEYLFGTDGYVRHRPSNDDDPGQLIYAWAQVDFKDGASTFVVLNRRQVNQRKASSQSANSEKKWVREKSPWVTHEESMWAKSAAKELSKWVPLSAEYQRAVALDDSAERGQQAIEMQGILNLPATTSEQAHQTQSDRLAERMKARAVDEAAHEPAPDDISQDNPDSEPTEEQMQEADLISAIEEEARRLGCPEDKLPAVVTVAKGESDPQAFIQRQTWRPARGERGNPKPKQQAMALGEGSVP